MSINITSNRTISVLAGLGLLIGFALSIVVNLFLLGPIVFSPDYLNTIAANETQVKFSALLQLLNGVLSVGVALLFLQIFLKHSKSLSLGFLVFSIFNLAVVVFDVFNVFSLLSLSKEYVNVVAETEVHFQLLGSVLSDNRWWSHYMELLTSCLPLLLFYILLFQTKLVPRFISIWGIAAVPLVMASVLLAMFGQDTYMELMMPLGLNQILIILWLLVKGFNNSTQK